MTDSDWLQYLEDRSQWERLSPAAKAVTDAAASAQWEQDAGGMRLSDVQEIAAAALRAAADQAISSVPPPCADFDEYAKGFLAAHVKYRRDLLAIAAELEGAAQATGSTH